MAAVSGSVAFQEVTNSTGRVFRVGETPRDVLGWGRWVPIMAAWLAMCLAGLLEYTWGALSGSLQAAHNWGARHVLAVLVLRHLRVVRADLHRVPAQPRASSTSGGRRSSAASSAASSPTGSWPSRPRSGRRTSGTPSSAASAPGWCTQAHQHRGQVVPGEEGLADRVRQRRLGLRRRAVHLRHRRRPQRRGAITMTRAPRQHYI